MYSYKSGLTRSRKLQIGLGDHAPFGLAWHRNRRIVLLRGIDAVRILVINIHPVELRCRLVVDT